MFTLFGNPFYYAPTYWLQTPQYSRRQSLFERYLDDLDQRFFSLLTDDAAQLLGIEERGKAQPPAASPPAPTPNAPAAAAATDAAPPSSSDAPPPKPEAKSEAKPAQPPTRPAQPRVRTQEYFSSTRSTFNGRDYVEEHRERVTGADGETRIATRRRLGDRWHENEVHVDKEGKRTERETWHNVGDDDIEAFKLEWSERHPPGKEPEPAPAAIAPPSDAAPASDAGASPH
jgi:hypothetical protein